MVHTICPAIRRPNKFPNSQSSVSLAYGARLARKKQEWLRTQSRELRAAIDFEARTPDALVIPVLAFPGYTVDGNLSELLETEVERNASHSRLRSGERRGAGETPLFLVWLAGLENGFVVGLEFVQGRTDTLRLNRL